MARKYRPKNPRGKAPVYDEETLLRIVAARRERHRHRNRAILLLSYYCGLRVQEIALLKVGQVRQGNVLLTDVQLGGITKGGKPREMYLVKAILRDALEGHLEAEERRMRRPLSNEDPLFSSQKGGHFTPRSMCNLFHAIYQDAGVPASSHSGRRSFATNLLQLGADVKSLQLLMGHSHVQTTLSYVDASPERLRKLAGML